MFNFELERLYREELIKDYLRESARLGGKELRQAQRGQRVRYSALVLLGVVSVLAVGFLLVVSKL